MKTIYLTEQALTELLNAAKTIKMDLARPGGDADKALQKQIAQLNQKIETGKKASTLSADAEYACRSAVSMLEDFSALFREKPPASGMEAFQRLKAEFDGYTKSLKSDAAKVGTHLSNVFRFCEEAFGEDQELLILVTELTISFYAARFISRYGCKEYFAHNKELLFYERQKEIIQEIEKLELED